MARTEEQLLRDLIFTNECSGNLNVVVKLTDADGVRSGKSGYSFGVSQFDTQNNPLALTILKECGFTDKEIHDVVLQTPGLDLKPLNAKLAAHPDVIEKYDVKQLAACLSSARRAFSSYQIVVAGYPAVLAAADYVNQYGSIGNGFKAYLKGLGRPVVMQDILDFKLQHTKYGREHADDCRRRFNNLVKLLEAQKTR